MLQEKSNIICKVCNQEKIRILHGTYDGVNKAWKDEKGGHFNGKVCPDCHRERQKILVRNRRSKTND